ncbi:MAG: dihydroorotate dehydrogenase-like protein [Actinobacteria bacterium]|nr:dihydroorotate dehydrogenase-like protein [Actinomycetota bacterium]MBU1493366.1 dihydroorotate dehydrogenase-like protein [Actinomycetota bacterium]MBU1864947.1 dihydroorotate dehydrogenase-like protein [Actinomycetota bacterium]
MNLKTTYLGLELDTPLVASASPLGRTIEGLHRLANAGASAVVLPSLFEEQIEYDSYQVHETLELGAESFPEHATGFLPEFEAYNTGPEHYIDLVARAREELAIPVIASLNGATTGGWVEYARRLEAAGASALELNVYFIATDVEDTSTAVEQRYLDLVAAVRETIDIPLAVKVGPYFSAMANMARRLTEAGADGLVLFNRFYQPDIHLEDLEVVPNVQLSTPMELRLPLRWIAILKGRVNASLAATTGVHSGEDVLKLLLAGADVTMMCSALLRHGPEWIRTVEEAVREWLESHEYQSVEQMKGSMSQASVPDPAAFERSNYMESLITYSTPNV